MTSPVTHATFQWEIPQCKASDLSPWPERREWLDMLALAGAWMVRSRPVASQCLAALIPRVSILQTLYAHMDISVLQLTIFCFQCRDTEPILLYRGQNKSIISLGACWWQNTVENGRIRSDKQKRAPRVFPSCPRVPNSVVSWGWRRSANSVVS